MRQGLFLVQTFTIVLHIWRINNLHICCMLHTGSYCKAKNSGYYSCMHFQAQDQLWHKLGYMLIKYFQNGTALIQDEIGNSLRDKINVPKYYVHFYFIEFWEKIWDKKKYLIRKIKPYQSGLIGRSALISNLPELENIMKTALNFQSESRSVMSDSLQPHGLSVQFSRSVVSDSLQPHEVQHTRPPCPSPTPGAYPNSCALSR